MTTQSKTPIADAVRSHDDDGDGCRDCVAAIKRLELSHAALLAALEGLVETVGRYWAQSTTSRREMPENTAAALETARAVLAKLPKEAR